MIVSEARIAANRRNALLSTGPRTEAGKERSRANALKHGLCSAAVVVEDPEAVRRRVDEWSPALRPGDGFQSWLVEEAALLSLRIERAGRIERAARDRLALRAGLGWEVDRRAEAEALGGRIGRRPAEVAAALRRTRQGCEWLMARWGMLAYAAERKGEGTPEQSRLAFDLLGTPAEFRDGRPPGAALDEAGRVVGPAADPAAVAGRAIAELKGLREVAADLDEADRALAESDLADDSDPELRRLRRYEAGLHRRLRWCLDQLPRLAGRPDPEPRGAVEPEPPAAEAEASGPGAPDQPEPDEGTGIVVHAPATPAHRREVRARKAESRRESRRRRLERLRN